eukprot:CAMPEP_0178446218 /NCGR_PEP_ID=MMETSP0689_2-20121128/40669_1 /TAXON_ID=160604 /ORGANISM="Amphidinium massartii, Strain CS-259" /LENGTH=311 /DNA_ID=CAMNT_0020070993 /DNA_START=81 /DNA_END=1012 /DNA_ORIENTATION=+
MAVTPNPASQAHAKAIDKVVADLNELLSTSVLHACKTGDAEKDLPVVMPEWWAELEYLMLQQEQSVDALEAHQWVSLRMRCHSWETVRKELMALGLHSFSQEGASSLFADAMSSSCRSVLDNFKAAVAFVQAGELVLLVAPTPPNPKSGKATLQYNGRAQKWTSVAASDTACVARQVAVAALAQGVSVSDLPIAYFDCHIGVHESQQAAEAFLLWRACVCKHDLQQLSTEACVAEVGLSPAEVHGCLYARTTAALEFFNDQLNQTVTANRSVNVLINDGAGGTPRSLLSFAEHGLSFIPPDSDARLALRPG